MKCQEASSRTLLSAHKSKSYEERELEYNEARSRIFNTESVSFPHTCGGGGCGNTFSSNYIYVKGNLYFAASFCSYSVCEIDSCVAVHCGRSYCIKEGRQS